MYLCKNHHEPIISHEVFELAAEVMAQRGKEKGIEAGDAKYLNRYALSGKIICGECGATFKRRTHYKPSGEYIAWTCCNHIRDRHSCSMLYIKDEDVKRALVRMMRKLQSCHEQVLKPFVAGLKGTNNKDRLHQVLELESQIEKNLEQQNVMVNLMSAGYIEPEIYHAERSALLMEADRLNKEKDIISKSINGDLTHLEEAQKLLRFVAKKNHMIEYDDALIQDYIEHVIVQSRKEVIFELKCGLKLSERLV